MGCVALSAKLQGSRTTSRQQLQRLEAIVESLPTEIETTPLKLPQTAGLERFMPSVPPSSTVTTDEATAETPSQALPASDRPTFEMPQNNGLQELDQQAPGLAELLDIQRRREGKKWQP
jgi:hypothetical protein